MGVLNTQDREKRDQLNFASNVSSPGVTVTVEENTCIIGDEHLGVQAAVNKRSHRTQQAKTSRAPRPQSYVKNTGRKARGCVNSRRFENAIFLSDLIEPGEFDELVITDFVNSQSAFKKLFEDETQMNTWHKFTSMNDEQQEAYLEELSNVTIRQCSLDGKATPNSGKTNFYNGSDLQKAAKCFQKLDRKIKTTLKKRNVSMVGLKFFEEEVLSFFTHINDGVLVSLIPSSMDRLLVHGLCQYMNLTSSSHPSHVVAVENTTNQFYPPLVPLSQYLQQIR